MGGFRLRSRSHAITAETLLKRNWAAVAATSSAIHARRRAAARRRFRARMAWLAVVLVIAVLGVGLVYAGSPGTLAAGTSVAGVDIGGLKRADAIRTLEQKYQRVAKTPIVFTSASMHNAGKPPQPGDWSTMVFFKDNFDPAITKFDHVHFEYGGAPGTATLNSCDQSAYGGYVGFDLGFGGPAPGFSITIRP